MNISQTAALVTGASRGFGAALAKELAVRGARVVLVAREARALGETVARIRADGGTAFALPADIADKNTIYPLAAAAAELVGPIDLLVHNASSLGPTPLRLLLDSECEDFERVLAVNLLGPFRLTRAIAGPGEMDTVMHRDALPDADPNTLSDPAQVARRLLSVLTTARVPSGARITADSLGEVP